MQHLSIDVADTRELLNRLEKLHVPFERNISVPNGRGKGASEGGRIEDTLVQYFIRDPVRVARLCCRLDSPLPRRFAWPDSPCPRRMATTWSCATASC